MVYSGFKTRIKHLSGSVCIGPASKLHGTKAESGYGFAAQGGQRYGFGP
jgi:hypothetical protein